MQKSKTVRPSAIPESTDDDGLPGLVKAERVAEWLDVERADVYQMVHTGEIPAYCIVRVGRRLRFYVDRLRSWLAELEGSSRASAK